MQDFLRYATFDVLEPMWSRMEAAIRKAENVDQVHMHPHIFGCGCRIPHFVGSDTSLHLRVWIPPHTFRMQMHLRTHLLSCNPCAQRRFLTAAFPTLVFILAISYISLRWSTPIAASSTVP